MSGFLLCVVAASWEWVYGRVAYAVRFLRGRWLEAGTLTGESYPARWHAHILVLRISSTGKGNRGSCQSALPLDRA